ncbi:MAG TPA: diacylglycerol kinase family protein [Burkholderiales bacterium]|nr:diacylglycerol kinase family protein [Burkholderiales bacterium]
MRVTLVHNPGAGRTDKRGEKELIALLEQAGHAVRYQSSKDDDWTDVLEKQADVVVAAGGDGTVGRVARHMAGRNVPLVALPAGTANNIARSLGLLDRSPEELVRDWGRARRVRLDVGVARGPFGQRTFVEGIGIGLFAGLLAASEGKPPKKPKGRTAAKAVDGALQRLSRCAEDCEALHVEARLDGRDISGRYLLLEAVNLRYVGPSLFLAPEAEPGDGQLDVVLVTEAERSRLVQYLERWQDNRERLAVLPTLRGRKLEIAWAGEPLHIDDKLRPKKGASPDEVAGMVEARLGEAAVEFLVPPDAKRG